MLCVCAWCCVYLCGVQYGYDFAEDRAFTFVFLADELDVSKLAEVEVPLLLQSVHSQLQIHQLRTGTTLENSDREAVLSEEINKLQKTKRLIRIKLMI